MHYDMKDVTAKCFSIFLPALPLTTVVALILLCQFDSPDQVDEMDRKVDQPMFFLSCNISKLIAEKGIAGTNS